MTAGCGRVCAVVLIVASAAAFTSTRSRAQAPSSETPDSVAADPLTCWWRASTNAVIVGEQFSVTITCAVVETSTITVEPDLTALEPTVVQLAPFQVVGSKSFQDIHSPPLRYFQREYTVRLLDDRFFGMDVEVPPVVVSYHIHTRSGQKETEGRTQAYVLSPLPIRVLSLVPQGATDIQDAAEETFGSIEARRTLATGAFAGGAILFGLAVVLLGVAVVRSVEHRRQPAPVVHRPLSPRRVLRSCLSDMIALKRDVLQQGWTPERVSRAQTSLRLAAAIALGRPVARRVADRELAARDGQLVVRTGIFRRHASILSAAATPASIDLDLADPQTQRPGVRTEGAIREVQQALRVFATARYARDARLDETALDQALETGAGAVRRLVFMKLVHRPVPPASPQVSRPGNM